jgi:hypothetical protein
VRAYDALLFSLVFLIFLSLLLGTLSSMNSRSFKAVHLESEEDTGASTNLGMITFDDVPYNLPDEISKTVATFSAEYSTDAGYLFDHWETTRLVSVSDANANPTTVTVSGDGTIKALYAAHHDDHLSDEYAPMVIPINDKNLTVAPIIMCTTLENDVYKPFHYPCKSARTTFVDNDWSDRDANYTYVFEDWTDNDWDDIVVSLYATTDDMITVKICLEDRNAAWKNPFSVEITPEGLAVDVHWNSTDYQGDHVVRANHNETVDIELFTESNPGDTALMTITPVIPPTYTLTITSTSGGTTNPIPGNHTYPEDTLVTVTATSFIDYVFDHWELDSENVGSPNPIDVTMNVNHTLEAVFTRITYTLTISVSGHGTTDPAEGSHVCFSGSTATVSATADPGWSFDHWTLDDSPAGSTIPIDVLMDDNHNLRAVFTQVTYTLAITATAGGSTSPSPGAHVYSSGTNVPVTANPDAGYIFDHWELDSANVGSDNPYTVTMNDDHALHAVFKPVVCYTLTITSTSGGTTNPLSGAYSYEEGTVVSVVANSGTGFEFDRWVLDGSNAGSGHLIPVTMDKDHTLHAVFSACAPAPVGGHVIPIDKTPLLAPKIDLTPRISLVFILSAAMAITIILIRRRIKRSSENLEGSEA